MRKLILKMSVSADGFVAGPNGEIDWLLRSLDESTVAWIAEALGQAGVHIMGSRTFHDMASYWPTATGPIAVAMNEIPKVVFSRNGFVDPTHEGQTTQALEHAREIDAQNGVTSSTTAASTSWTDVPIAKGALATELIKLKSQDGKNIIAHGGARFAQSLVTSGLVDEYQLLVHPIALGKGLPLFSAIPTPIHLKLEQSTARRNGLLDNVYTPLK